MRKVWKYPVPLDDHFTVDLPTGAQVIAVEPQLSAVQFAELSMWALVDPDASRETRTFRFVGTGHPITGNVVHISTFQIGIPVFVGHVFEVLGDDPQ